MGIFVLAASNSQRQKLFLFSKKTRFAILTFRRLSMVQSINAQSFKKSLFTHLPIAQAFALLLISLSPKAHAEIQWAGFGSAYYAQALTRHIQPADFVRGEQSPPMGGPPQNTWWADFSDFSSVGLEARAKITEEFDAYVQIVGLGAAGENSTTGTVPNFTLFAQFAYLRWMPFPTWEVKVGRQSTPMWAVAETYRIGAVLPFRGKPKYVFNITSFGGMDAISLAKDFNFDSSKLNIIVFYGTPVDDLTYPSFITSSYKYNFYGLRLALSGEGWKVRLQSSSFYNPMFVTKPDNNTYSVNQGNITLGYTFDKYNVVSWSEFGYFRGWNGSQTVADADQYRQSGKYWGRMMGGYFLLGYRFGDFMPRYTYGRAKSWDPTFMGATISHVMGFNYEFSKKVILKAEYEIDLVPPNSETGYMIEPQAAYAKEGASIARAIYAGFDFLF
jgi:hypothetical protein